MASSFFFYRQGFITSNPLFYNFTVERRTDRPKHRKVTERIEEFLREEFLCKLGDFALMAHSQKNSYFIHIYIYISCLHSFKQNSQGALVLRGHEATIACKRIDLSLSLSLSLAREQPVTTNKVKSENFSPSHDRALSVWLCSLVLCPFHGGGTRGP